MHLDDEQLQRLLHAQLPSRAARNARDHLAECGECRERFVAAQQDESRIFALLRQVDHEVPVLDPAGLAGGLRWIPPLRKEWMVAMLLALGLAVAAGMWIWGAGSPWLPKVSRAPVPTGVATMPGSRLVIAFERPQPGGNARVSFSDDPQVTVRATRGTAHFASHANQLVITGHDSGARYEILIPRRAPRVEIQVAGARVFLKNGAKVTAPGRAGPGGVYLIPLSSR